MTVKFKNRAVAAAARVARDLLNHPDVSYANGSPELAAVRSAMERYVATHKPDPRLRRLFDTVLKAMQTWEEADGPGPATAAVKVADTLESLLAAIKKADPDGEAYANADFDALPPIPEDMIPDIVGHVGTRHPVAVEHKDGKPHRCIVWDEELLGDRCPWSIVSCEDASLGLAE